MLIDWITPGRVFSGFFQIDPKKAERYFKRRNERKVPESEERDRIYAGYVFTMEVTSLDRNNGMFEARGEDFYGPSNILGQIKSNNIQFRKRYTDEQKSSLRQFEQADFIGSAITIGDAMIAGGEYHPTLRKWKIYEGIWQMDKNPDGKTASVGWMEPKPWIIKPLRVEIE
jgi:hypothetical protein